MCCRSTPSHAWLSAEDGEHIKSSTAVGTPHLTTKLLCGLGGAGLGGWAAWVCAHNSVSREPNTSLEQQHTIHAASDARRNLCGSMPSAAKQTDES